MTTVSTESPKARQIEELAFDACRKRGHFTLRWLFTQEGGSSEEYVKKVIHELVKAGRLQAHGFTNARTFTLPGVLPPTASPSSNIGRPFKRDVNVKLANPDDRPVYPSSCRLCDMVLTGPSAFEATTARQDHERKAHTAAERDTLVGAKLTPAATIAASESLAADLALGTEVVQEATARASTREKRPTLADNVAAGAKIIREAAALATVAEWAAPDGGGGQYRGFRGRRHGRGHGR